MREVRVTADGRLIPRGRIIVDSHGERTWECRVRESKHLYRAMDAWTVSEVILRQLRDLGIDRIRYIVTDRDGEIYEVSLTKFLDLAEPLDQSGWSSQTEEQYALPRRFWERRGSTHKQLALQL